MVKKKRESQSVKLIQSIFLGKYQGQCISQMIQIIEYILQWKSQLYQFLICKIKFIMTH